MAFAHVLASNGVSYFLCSLGYFFLGVILITQLKRETHMPTELKALKVLALYGFVRGTFYFGELLFLISFQQVSPLTEGAVHELIWVAADYLTVSVFFAFAFHTILSSGYRKALQRIISGLAAYWISIVIAATNNGLAFTDLSTWAKLKPFFICIPSFIIVVISFKHLSERLKILGFTKRAQSLKYLAIAYAIQAVLVFIMAYLYAPLFPHLGFLSSYMATDDNIPMLRVISALVLMSIVYLVYTLVTASEKSESQYVPTQVEDKLINEMTFGLANQVCNVLDVDTVAFFLLRPDKETEVLSAIQGLPLNLPSMVAQNLTRSKVEGFLHQQYKAVHTVPIELNSTRLGTILIANRKRRPLSPSDTRFLHSIATQTGRTIIGIRSLAENIEVKAIQEERLRISREMHDGLSPLLAYMRFKIEAAKGLLEESDHDPVAHTFEEIDGVINEAFADVRESIVGLRCSISQNDLLERIRETIEHFCKLTKVTVVTHFPELLPPLHPKQEMQVLRIIQEVLTNVRKHAQATQVEISIIHDAGALLFRVIDNGCGFDPNEIRDGHFGLSTMKERSADIGGKLTITSQEGQGTEVTLAIPDGRKEQVAADAQSIDSRRPRPVPRGTSEPSFVQS